MKPNIKLLGDRINERLAAISKSAREVSLRISSNPDAVRSILRGAWPGANRLWLLAQELECTPQYLMGATHDPQSTESKSLDAELLASCIEAIDIVDKKGNLNLTLDHRANAAATLYLKKSQNPSENTADDAFLVVLKYLSDNQAREI